METLEENITTEDAAFADILEWSAGLPAWQRDALRRLCEQTKLEADDILTLIAICKGTEQAKPLAASHIRDSASSNMVVTLGALHSLSNVNALAPGERLSFAKIGLTVIYGDNGAGKSGYARVLKQACRARLPKGDTILANIYATSNGPPSGTLDFFIGAQRRSAIWTQGSPSDPLLSAVSVFDSRTANIHVENTNELAYTPLPLRVLANLADACQQVKTALAKEVDALQAQTPAILSEHPCGESTAVGKLMTALSGKTKAVAVEALAGISEQEDTRLQTLVTDLATDPVRTVRQLQRHAERISTVIEQLEKLAAAAAEESRNELHEAHIGFLTASAACAAASANLFANEPLPEIGSSVWRVLWEAARKYSTEAAYPEKSFPVVEGDARCVLCQQSLDTEAAKRLARFEEFVRDESKRREEEAADTYSNTLSRLSSQSFPMKELRLFVALIRDEVGNKELADLVHRQVLLTACRLRSVLRTHRVSNAPPLPPAGEMPVQDLRACLADITKRVSALQTEATSPERIALIAERDELTDRKWLGIVKADVLAQIDRLKAIETLEKASKTTSTSKITTQSGRIARALVTNRLRSRFAIEVNELGVGGLAIELQQAKSAAGVPYFQVRLINKPSEGVGKVLSEGEHRCVALGAFLAELSTVDAQSAIVFDDPVSSLDHLHRDKVAARLASEGQKRQVIVFTHDMAFLLLLEEACRAIKQPGPTHIAYQSVSRGPDHAGFVHPDPPANVMPLDKVIAAMKVHLGNVRIHHTRGNQANWLREVKSFQEQLRTGWERAVEDFVGPVIRRLARKVDTTGLVKLTVLTGADCDAVRDAFKRCSELLHSQPGELNPRLPDPTVIEGEIHALEKWISDTRARQDRAA